MAIRLTIPKDDVENHIKEDMADCYAKIKNINIIVEDNKVYANVWIYVSSAARGRVGCEPLWKIQIEADLTALDLQNISILKAPKNALITNMYRHIKTLARFSGGVDV